MTFVISLPDAIVSILLTDWLQIQDVARLDSAICQATSRQQFIQLAYAGGLVYNTRHVVYHTSECIRKLPTIGLLQWTKLRGACISAIAITQDLTDDAEHRSTVLSSTGASNRSIFYVLSKLSDLYWKQTWNELLSHCPNVVELVCHSAFGPSECVQIGQTWPDLESIQLGDYATDDCLHNIGLYYHKLRRFHGGAGFSRRNTTKGWCNFIRQVGRTLEHIEGFEYGNEAFDAELFAAIAEHCRNLKSYAADCSAMKREHLAGILQGCPYLTSLTLRSAGGMDDNETLQLIADKCGSRLKILRLSDWSNITDAGVVGLLEVCRNLEALELSDVPELSDATFEAIGRYCPQLQDLNLFCLHRLGSEGLCLIAAGCPKLQRLTIVFAGVQDTGLISVLTNCPLLKYLNLSNCTGLSEQSLTAVARVRSEVTDLFLSGTKLTLTGLQTIAQQCTKLRYVMLSSDLEVEADANQVLLATLFAPAVMVVVE